MLQKILCLWGKHSLSTINLSDCIEVVCLAPDCRYKRTVVNGKCYE